MLRSRWEEEEMTELKQTPLFDYYQKNQVKLVDFGGWAMPIQFTGIIKEHEAVRERLGLFDCSHMGEIEVSGSGAEAYLNHLVTNNVSKMTDGSVQYNIICQENGGAIDDVMIYRFNQEKFVVVPNASNADRVWTWMGSYLTEDAQIENKTAAIGLIAVQGPLAESVLQSLTDQPLSEIGRHRFIEDARIADYRLSFISRTGYTGEDGFELYLPAEDTTAVWEEILKASEAVGGLACGLGARDTLRLEAGLPLYGQELSEDISPIMAGVGFAVKTKKAAAFIGQSALRQQREEGTTHKVVGFEVLERGIPRHGYTVLNQDGHPIGEVTSGTQSPTLKKGIGMALIQSDHSEIGTDILIEIRNKTVAAKVTSKTFLNE